uniref:Uncharacterized protein n=1 Tax=Rhizophora mucronata TaxID=61149 RepID=A0A2P2QXV4_RHIMU
MVLTLSPKQIEKQKNKKKKKTISLFGTFNELHKLEKTYSKSVKII